MKNYENFRYVYPPRPEVKSPPSGLPTYERMGYIAQPKLNGSCALVFVDNNGARMMGRHNNSFARELIDRGHLQNLQRGAGFTVLVGEYMNKSQKDGKRKLFNGCFVIFDILVHNGNHLVKSTFEERQELLDNLYGEGQHYDEYINYISPSVYRVKNFSSNFVTLFNNITTVEMYEGFVLKRPNGILENGLRPNNNTGWQLKIRKPTKNYKY
jgi:hypothetical protein